MEWNFIPVKNLFAINIKEENDSFNIMEGRITKEPVPVAAWSKAFTFLGHWKTGIMGPNSFQCMGLYPLLSGLSYPLCVEALR
jgi:hypothetical protein